MTKQVKYLPARLLVQLILVVFTSVNDDTPVRQRRRCCLHSGCVSEAGREVNTLICGTRRQSPFHPQNTSQKLFGTIHALNSSVHQGQQKNTILYPDFFLYDLHSGTDEASPSAVDSISVPNLCCSCRMQLCRSCQFDTSNPHVRMNKKRHKTIEYNKYDVALSVFISACAMLFYVYFIQYIV